MRIIFPLVLITLSLPLWGGASETANATLSCYSLQFQRGSEAGGNYYLDLGSLSGSVNGELALDFLGSGYTHSAYMTLEDDLLGETLSGQMGLDVPTGGDANGDGFYDFFQVSQGITNLTSSGAYMLQVYGNGAIGAVWNRPAGSSYGTCALSMTLMPFTTVTFYHTFQVLEYKGSLIYTPGTNSVSGSVNLSQTDNPTAIFAGPVLFVKSTTDPFNSLTLQAGALTNESEQIVSYVNDVYSRDSGWPTNYYGYFQMTDTNNPGAFYPYGTWLLSIDDMNDSNHNGIPDFSDVPSASTLAPLLAIAPSGTNLLLTVTGAAGYTADIEILSDLGSTNWQTTVSVGITNDPQNVSLPLPTSSLGFWRARLR